MRPIDFVLFDGDSSPNMPVREVAEAMTREVRVFGYDGEYEILSYYFDDGQMILDVQKKQPSRNKQEKLNGTVKS